MNTGQFFLWGAVPYLTLAIFIIGHIYRFNTNQFTWTSKSSEILEKKLLKWGSPMFHWGIIFVFFGHVAGLVIPKSVYETLGISHELYHTIAVWAGLCAGVLTVTGLAILMIRRFAVRRVRLTSSFSDLLVLVLLALAIGSGMAATTFNASYDFDYRETISPWFRGILTAQPHPELMALVPLPFKIHILSVFALFAVWPFTRLVHVFSVPIHYLRRSYVVYRRRKSQSQFNEQATQHQRRIS